MSLLQSRLLPPLISINFDSWLPCPLPRLSYPVLRTSRILCAKRRGKQRYPSEKKKLRQKQKEALANVDDKLEGIWRLSKLGVAVSVDPGKDFVGVSEGLLKEIAKVLKFPVASMLPPEAFSVVRKSFDARKILKEPKFVYTVDVNVSKLLSLEPRAYDFIHRLEPKLGLIEHMPAERVYGDLIDIIDDCRRDSCNESLRADENGFSTGYTESHKLSRIGKPKIGVVGSGPSGLFASLVLAEFGADVTLIERGRAVEKRGRDIGALVVRRVLDLDSNYCFGEGGAGTWSDGKLVTRIGRNSGSVLAVMNTLVHFGAPKGILVDGKPHVGTDRLVPLLRNFRQHLLRIGVDIKFDTRVDDLLVEADRVVGIRVSDSMNKTNEMQRASKELRFDAVILAVGHSARDVYDMLLSHNMGLVPKDFAVGLRVEHPQALINTIQYSQVSKEIRGGRGKVPVADYKLVQYIESNTENNYNPDFGRRSCYSFCMCPGGQVVLTSTNPAEICINGMSFSRRSSKWANAALVVTVSSKDFDEMNFLGPLAGVKFQREFEQRAANMGGGNFVVPVQTVTDFLDGRVSATPLPPSSYRLGVKAADLHNLFPSYINDALRCAISMFDKELPGFISNEGLLHGVETRTSSPVQIPRSSDTYESTCLKGLFPVGEGAGYAGGIVSAAVDGMLAGFSVAGQYDLFQGNIESIMGMPQGPKLVKY